MSSYTSVKSYSLLVTLRSTKTILVEGVCDKRVVSRLLKERHLSEGISPDYCIDDASMINDPDLAGTGNKKKVNEVARFIGEKDNFLSLMDREWDGWDFSDFSLSERTEEVGLVTKGHSIENYWFLVDALSGFFMNQFSHVLPVDYFAELRSRFVAMLRFAAAFSLACKEANVINRCGGLLLGKYLIWGQGGYGVTEGLGDLISSRKMDSCLLKLIADKAEGLAGVSVDNLQWLGHGHLAEEAIRACAASLALEFNIDEHVVRCIESGNKAEKLNFDAAFISTRQDVVIDPLDRIVEWVAR